MLASPTNNPLLVTLADRPTTDTVQNKENANLDNINLDYMALCESFISLRRSEY